MGRVDDGSKVGHAKHPHIGNGEGPALALFTSEFYGNCKRILNPNGIFVNQNGVPFLQKDELTLTTNNRKPHFKNVTFYTAPVPTYVGGFMAFGWASDKKYKISEKVLTERLSKIKGKMNYYTPAHPQSLLRPAAIHARLEKKQDNRMGRIGI